MKKKSKKRLKNKLAGLFFNFGRKLSAKTNDYWLIKQKNHIRAFQKQFSGLYSNKGIPDGDKSSDMM